MFRRRLVLANAVAIVVITIVGITAVVALRTARQHLEAAHRIDHRLAIIDQLRSKSRELALSARRFMMSGDFKEQQRVFAIADEMRGERARLGPRAAFKPAARLDADLDEYLAALTALMSLEDGDAESRLLRFEDDLARIRAPLSETFDDVISAERARRERLRTAHTLARSAQWAVVAACALALVLLVASLASVVRRVGTRAAPSNITRSRNELLAAATELRTPLENIIADTSQLRIVQRDAMTGRVLDNIARNASRVNAMLAELLDVTAMQTGAAALRREPVDAAALVDRVIRDHRDDAQQRGVVLRYEAQLAVSVFADRERVRHVLDSLLQIAIPSARAGGELVVQVAAAEGSIRFAIIEAGPGTDPQPFGHDLALHLCSRIVEAHGGRLGIQTSSVSRTYWFTLPTEPRLLR